MLKPAVFFDRDGVLNVEKGYVYKISDFEWMKGAKEAIKYLNEADYLVCLLYTSPSPRDRTRSRMPSSA